MTCLLLGVAEMVNVPAERTMQSVNTTSPNPHIQVI